MRNLHSPQHVPVSRAEPPQEVVEVVHLLLVDMLRQPVHQVQIVRQTAKQGHGSMCVQIHQTRHEQLVVQDFARLGAKAVVRIATRKDIDDPASIDCDGMIFQQYARRLYRKDPTGLDQQINVLQTILMSLKRLEVECWSLLHRF